MALYVKFCLVLLCIAITMVIQRFSPGVTHDLFDEVWDYSVLRVSSVSFPKNRPKAFTFFAIFLIVDSSGG
jgi:hypothetical protein